MEEINNGTASIESVPPTAKEPNNVVVSKEEMTSKTADSDSVVPDVSLQANQNGATEKQKLSKRKRRRLLKKELWLTNLPAKRAKEKLKNKLKKEEARKLNISLGPTRQSLKKLTMTTSNCKVRVALDFSFDHLMTHKDICKCIQQILRCYSMNRRAVNPLQFYIVNFNGQSRQEISKHNGYEHWDVHIQSEPYLDLFPKESLVYLSSESNNLLESFDDTKVYIIGALVDHNSQKGLCLNIAKEQGIQHAQLPIAEYLDMKTRKVLAINHVFDIILKVCNGRSWKEAFVATLPMRKGAVPKQTQEASATESTSGETEDNT